MMSLGKVYLDTSVINALFDKRTPERQHLTDHLVKVKTRRLVALLNSINNYQPVEIIAPPEL